MRIGPFALVCAAGCTADPSGADTGPARDALAPIVARCADPGPDAPVRPRVTPVLGSFEGAPLQVHLPDGLRAVVFYFYGSEDLSEWNGLEQTAFANQMATAGIGWVVYTKADNARGDSWDSLHPDFADNEDLSRLARLWNELVDTTPLEADTPILSSGFSDGGGFALMFASETARQLGWPIVGAIVHNSLGEVAPRPDVPVWITASDFDEPAVQAGARQIAESQTARGFPSVYVQTGERTLSPEVFLRHPDQDLAQATAVYDDLVAYGLVDAAGQRLVPPDGIGRALDRWAEETAIPAAAVATARIHVVWATHRYSALHTREACAFVLDRLEL